jgi:LmbE family N-acetylglucosaminyl deacetylase
VTHEFPTRPLIFVAHPDDETIACGGLLQRLPASFVVFATDGAAPGYNFEKKFGSLKAYSDLRFQEASRALRNTPKASIRRLARADGSSFIDQHLFEELPAAALSLRAIAQSFAPDAIVSHAYEGGHLDHDACSFLAMHIGESLALMRFEFPLYWFDRKGKLVPQQFRGTHAGAVELGLADTVEWELTEVEIQIKNKMLAEYRTQSGIASLFQLACERFRRADTTSVSFSVAPGLDYSFQGGRLKAKALLKKFAEFESQQPRTKRVL